MYQNFISWTWSYHTLDIQQTKKLFQKFFSNIFITSLGHITMTRKQNEKGLPPFAPILMSFFLYKLNYMWQ